MRSRTMASALAVLLCSAGPTSAQPAAGRAEVLVLGVYHMANPGKDVFSTQADDVLAPKRQQEIAQLIAVLKKFAPTKIAIESDPGGQRERQYADYLAGKYTLTRNEIDQVGFRLAKDLGHKTIYPVDADGEFQWDRIVDFAKAHDRSAELDSIQADLRAMVSAQDAFLASHSVFETLLYMNADDRVAFDVGLYYREAHLGQQWNWAGADFITEWFRRNMRIYSNVVQIAGPGERVLVIFGSGHLGWLRHDFGSDPTIRLWTLAELAKG